MGENGTGSVSGRKHPLAKCEECPLKKYPYCPPYIPDDAKIIFLGEAPGAMEIQRQRPFVGPSGQLVQGVLDEVKGPAFKTMHRTNVVLCRPPNNREPKEEEEAACWPRLQAELTESPAKIIIAAGKVANVALMGDVWSPSLRGSWQRWGSKWIMPTWHPAYVLRKPSEVKALTRDIRLALKGPLSIEVGFTIPDYEVIEDAQHLQESLPDPDKRFTFDLETNNVVWYDRPSKLGNAIMMMAFTHTALGNKGFIIPDYLLYDDDNTRGVLNDFFSRATYTIGHNASFDVQFLTRVGVKAHVDSDSILAKFCLNEDKPHGLKEVVHHRYNVPDYEAELVQKYLRSRNDEYSKVPFEELAKYAAADVVLTHRLEGDLMAELVAQGRVEWPYRQILMRGQEALRVMEDRGIQVDLEYMHEASEFVQSVMDDLTVQMRDMASKPEFNPNAWAQVAEVLWNDLKLPRNKRTRLYRERPDSTAQEAVEHLASYNPKTHIKVRDGDPFVDLLMEYRRAAKMKGSYIDNIIEFADINGRVHPSWLAYGTEVGRLAAHDPAFQTTPRPSDLYGSIIRAGYVAKPGHVLVLVDFSQAELRTFAAETMSPFLLNAYEYGRDIHSEVAAIMYGDNFNKEQRVMAKMWDFAYVYGGNEYSFARDAGMPLNEAIGLVQKFNERIPEAMAYRDSQFEKMLKQGYVQSRFGRRRHAMLITRANEDEVRKASVHAIIAGSAHDLTFLSLIRLTEEGYPTVAEVHDSVILEVPIEDADEVSEYTQQVMLETAQHWYPEVKWKVDPEIGERWSERPNWQQRAAELTSNATNTP